MFELYTSSNARKELTEESYSIYDIKRNKNGYPEFLIFNNGQWKYVSAKNFSPNPIWKKKF